MPRPRKAQTVKAGGAVGAVYAMPPSAVPTRRIALLAVDSSSRPDALEQAEIVANEHSAALAAAGATVLSIRTQVLYASPWHVIVTIEYEAQGG